MTAMLPKPISVQTINSLRQKDSPPELNYETHKRSLQAVNQLIAYLNDGQSNTTIEVDGKTITTLAQAISAAPQAGATIDMRGNSSSAALALGSIDPGTKSITILLGPFVYSLNQMVVRTNLHVIGAGSFATRINQVDASTAPFVLGGGLSPANIARNVLLSGFDLEGVSGNTTDGLSFVVLTDSNGLGGGMWYSALYDLTIGNAIQFGRNQIRFDSTVQGTGNSADQWISVRNVFAFRKLNGPPVLYITGQYSGQMTFDDCQFDGPFNQFDTASNIYNIRVDDGNVSGGNYLPYSVVMTNITSQFCWGTGSAAIFLNGTSAFTLRGGHFETCSGIIKEQISGVGKGNWGVTITDSYMVSSGINGGTGFIGNLDANSSLVFTNNTVAGTPDNWFTGTPTYVAFSGITDNSGGGWQPIGVQLATASATSATAGTHGAVPGQVAGYLNVSVGGTLFKVPYFNV